MADFCMNCYKELGFPEPDLSAEKCNLKPGNYMRLLCEHCGYIYIELDDDGETEWVFVGKQFPKWKSMK